MRLTRSTSLRDETLSLMRQLSRQDAEASRNRPRRRRVNALTVCPMCARLCERARKGAAIGKDLRALCAEVVGAEVQCCDRRAAAETLANVPDRLRLQLVGAELQLRCDGAMMCIGRRDVLQQNVLCYATSTTGCIRGGGCTAYHIKAQCTMT